MNLVLSSALHLQLMTDAQITKYIQLIASMRVCSILHAIKINPKSFSNVLHTRCDEMNGMFSRGRCAIIMTTPSPDILNETNFICFSFVHLLRRTPQPGRVHTQQSTACRIDDKYYIIKLVRIKRAAVVPRLCVHARDVGADSL